MAETLGTFEQAVLLAILRLGDEAYGRAILSAVEQRMGREVVAGAVHATLERLERKGLIGSRLASGSPVRSGRARRYYAVQSAGLAALNQARSTLDAIWKGFPDSLASRIIATFSYARGAAQ